MNVNSVIIPALKYKQDIEEAYDNLDGNSVEQYQAPDVNPALKKGLNTQLKTKDVTGEIDGKTIACVKDKLSMDAEVGTPEISLPKPLVVGGLVVGGLLFLGVCIWIGRKIVKQ